MADVRWEIDIKQTDGTAFSSENEAGAAVRLRNSTVSGSDGSEYTGNDAGSGAFSETGKGLWYIMIDSGDSGFYLVESYTTASGAWTSVNGFAPIYIPLEDFLPKTGGTMSGNIVMSDNSITGIDTLTFTDTAGTVAGIQNGNLLDKSASETISGNWACTGFFDITASKLKIGGTAVTTTAAQMNMLNGLTDTYHLPTLEKSLAYNTSSVLSGATTLTIADAGHIPVDSSGGTFQITMPVITEATSGAIFNIYVGTGGNDITVVDNAANGGFVFMTASDTETTGGTLTFGADGGDHVTLMSNGGTTSKGFWLVLGGTNILIS